MKVIVFGARGKTGRLVVAEAKARGHQVTECNEKLKAGDDVSQRVAGHDSVINCIGPGHMKPSTVRTDAATVLVRAMEKAGVRRLISMSGLGAGDSLDAQPFFVRKVIAPLLLKHLIADSNGLERAIQASTLEWTLVRPGELKDGPKKELKISETGRGTSASVPRASVAEFIVAQLTNPAWIRKAPSVGT